MPADFLYDAFISYNHKLDKPLVKRLQRQLQSLGKAWWQRRAVRIFRDEANQGATPELWPGGKRIVTASTDKLARLWDAQTGRVICNGREGGHPCPDFWLHVQR